jgi:hypothetical protein
VDNTGAPRVLEVGYGEEQRAASAAPNGHRSLAERPETDSAYMAGLVAAALDKKGREAIMEIARPTADGEEGPVLFRFGVRMVEDAEDEALRRRHTTPDESSPTGERLDWVRYRCEAILAATWDQPRVEEIRGEEVTVAGKELWRDPKAWRQVSDAIGRRIINPVDFIDAVLLPDEKTDVFRRIGDLAKVGRGREIKRALNA